MEIEEDKLVILADAIRKIERASSVDPVMLNVLQAASDLMEFDYSVVFLFDLENRQVSRHAIAQLPQIEVPLRELVRLLHAMLPHHFEIGTTTPDDQRIFEWNVGSDFYLLNESTVLTALFTRDGALHGALCICRKDRPYGDFDHMVLQALEPSVTYKLHAFSDSSFVQLEKSRELQESFNLSNRELEVAECIANGMNTADIASKLNISARTVEKHLERIYQKTGMNNRLSLIRFIQIYLQG